jgi:hypothetical protein
MVPPGENSDSIDLDELSPREVWDRVSLAVQAKRPEDALPLAEALLEKMPELAGEFSPLVERLRHWDGAARRSKITARVLIRRSEPIVSIANPAEEAA